MNEKPKSIWTKSLKLPGLLMAWLILMAATLLVFLIIFLILGASFVKVLNLSDLTKTFIASLIVATFAFCLWLFIRWLGCWRNFKRFLFGLACLATLVALGYAVEDWRGWHAWNQFKHAWEAKGEHFDFASVVPPTVPDEQNFALTPVVASCYASILDKSGHKLAKWDTNVINRLDFDLGDRDLHANVSGNWAKGIASDLKSYQANYRELAAKTNLFAVPPTPQSPAADVLLALGKYDSTVEELRQASELPQSRFPLNYDTDCPANILLPQLAALKNSSQLLRLRALAELQAGQSDKALADVKLALRLTEAIRAEPFLISQLVRLAIWQIMLQPVYEGLAEHKWSDAQLVALDAELAKLDFLADCKVSMRGELGMQGGIFEFLRRQPEQIPNLLGMFGGETDPQNFHPPVPVKILTPLIPAGWFYQNQLHCARPMVNHYIPLADVGQQTISPAATRHADEAVTAEISKATPYNLIARMLIPSLGNAAKKFAYGQASVNLARTAIALERYRLAHGEFPDSLDALAPQFLEKIPHDVIGGGALKYRRDAAGQFVLYSVGWNESDDGGAVVFKKGESSIVDISEGDWVWRYPAK